MSPILALPQEIILEIAKALDLKDALALISTCKPLHAITQARSFWLDQLRRLYELFRPLIPQDLAPLSIEDLRAMVTTPYRFEQTVMQGQLREVPPVRLKHDLVTEFLDAKIVPGGRWIVTANRDWDGFPSEDVPFVRLWRLVPKSSPQDAFPCIASKQLHIGYRPIELCITAGEGSLDLLVLVNSLNTVPLGQGCYIQVLHIDLAAEEPELVVLAEWKPERFCSGIRLQGASVVANVVGLFRDEPREFLVWDWKTGESRTLPSLGDGKNYWFTAASERACAVWNVVDKCIEVHWSDPPSGHNRVERHPPPPSDDDQESNEWQPFIEPIVREFRDRSGDHFQIALAHLPRETVRAKIEDCGEGRISFLRYRRNLGSNDDIPSELAMTASSHLLAISPSGQLTIYRTKDCESQTNLGESVSCHPFAGVDIHSRWTHRAFVCPFSGIVGCISVHGDFHIWQQK